MDAKKTAHIGAITKKAIFSKTEIKINKSYLLYYTFQILHAALPLWIAIIEILYKSNFFFLIYHMHQLSWSGWSSAPHSLPAKSFSRFLKLNEYVSAALLSFQKFIPLSQWKISECQREKQKSNLLIHLQNKILLIKTYL